jgi:hypothetical protein
MPFNQHSFFMSYVVLRTAKLKNAGSIGGLNDHLTRTMDVPNADPELQKYNTRPIGTTDLNEDIMNRIRSLGIEPRANAVLAVEHLITSGAEAFQYHKSATGELRGDVKKWNAFESRALGWLETQYGEENLVNFTVHKDENAPHIHAIIVPITGGRLNCRAFLGGREKLRGMQSSIAEVMKPLDLERGIEGSRANHTTLKAFYASVEKGHDLALEMRNAVNAFPKITLGKIPIIGQKEWKEGHEATFNKRIEDVIDKYEPIVKISIHLIEENKKLKQQIKNMSKENVKLRDTNKTVRGDIRDLLITKNIREGMRETYLPDIIKQEKQAAEKQQPRTWDNSMGM